MITGIPPMEDSTQVLLQLSHLDQEGKLKRAISQDIALAAIVLAQVRYVKSCILRKLPADSEPSMVRQLVSQTIKGMHPDVREKTIEAILDLEFPGLSDDLQTEPDDGSSSL